MSFKCDKCGDPQSDGTSPNKVVTETRKRVYETKMKKSESHLEPDKEVEVIGQEIVEEKNLCDSCKDLEVDDEQ